MYNGISEQHANQGVAYEYTPEQRAILELHIEEHFGPISFVISQKVNKDIKLDIAVIEPSISRKRNFYTLITMGLGAFVMENRKIKDSDSDDSDYVDRCELVLMLDSHFKIPSASEEYYWPIRLLKELSRSVIDKKVFLDWGVVYTQNKSFSSHTFLSHAVICGLNRIFAPTAQGLSMMDDLDIAFYFVLPLFKEEYGALLKIAGLKEDHDVNTPIDNKYLNSFISQMRFIDPLVFNDRANGANDDAEYDAMICEDYRWHESTIDLKSLDLPNINALNHISILFEYLIENGMLSDDFLSLHNENELNILTGKVKSDLRTFILESLSGMIYRVICNEKGLTFLNQYMSSSRDVAPVFTADIDSYALRYFGIDQYYSKEFDTEGYLFVSYTADYYSNMKQVMDQRALSFAEQKSQTNSTDEQIFLAMERYLDCNTTFFPMLQNDTPIKAFLNYSYRKGAYQEYIPLIIEVNKNFFELTVKLINKINPSLTLLTSPKDKYIYPSVDTIHDLDSDYVKRFGAQDEVLFNRQKVQAVRYNCMNTPDILDGSSITQEVLKFICKNQYISQEQFDSYLKLKADCALEFEQDKKERNKHIKKLMGRGGKGLGILCSYNAYERAKICLGPLNKAENFELSSYWDEKTNYTKPVLIAHLPIDDPTMIMPYLSFLYPSNNELIHLDVVRLSNYFWNDFRAIPAVVTQSGIEYITTTPLSKNKAMLLAFDIIIMGDYLDKSIVRSKVFDLVPNLAKMLENKTSFFFPINTPREGAKA